MLDQQQINNFRKWALARGYTDAQINQEIARKQQEVARTQARSTQPTVQQPTTPTVPTQTPPVKEKRTLGGLVKNAGQDILDFAVNTPIQTIKSTFGASMEAARARDVSKGGKNIESIQKQLDDATEAYIKEKDPAKKKLLQAKRRQISDQLGQTTGSYLQRTQKANPAVDVNQLPSSVGEVGKGIVKNVGKTFGLEMDETGRIVFNLDTLIQSAYEKPVTTALVAKDLGGSVLNKVKGAGAAKTATKDAGFLEKQGSNLREGVLNPKVKGSPFVSEDAAAMQKIQQKLGLKGSAKAQLEQLPDIFRKSQKEIKTLLNESKTTKKGVLSDEFLKHVDDSNYNLSDPQFSSAVEREMDVLKNLDGKSALEQYNQLEKYRDLLKSTRRKIDRGTTLLPKEEARLAAFNALKASIDTVSPEVRALNTLQNQIYNISEGLFKSSKQKGVGIGQVRVPAEATQTLQDTAGRLLQGTAGVGEKIGAVGSRIPQIPQGTGLGMAAGGALQIKNGNQDIQQPTQDIPNDLNGEVSNNYVDQQSQPGQSIAHPIYGNHTKEEVLLDAYRSGLNSKEIDEVGQLYDRFAPQGGTVDEKTMGIANDLRKEYISETKNNNFREITNAYNKVVTAPNTPAGDVSLIFAYMKMLDPGSTVREGEYATAENTAGIPGQIVNAYNKALKGKKLNDEQRAGFVDASREVYNGYKSSQDAIDQQYASLAQRYGVDPTLLGIGTIKTEEPKTQPKTQPATESKKKDSPVKKTSDSSVKKSVVAGVTKVLDAITPTASASDGTPNKEKTLKDKVVEAKDSLSEKQKKWFPKAIWNIEDPKERFKQYKELFTDATTGATTAPAKGVYLMPQAAGLVKRVAFKLEKQIPLAMEDVEKIQAMHGPGKESVEQMVKNLMEYIKPSQQKEFKLPNLLKNDRSTRSGRLFTGSIPKKN